MTGFWGMVQKRYQEINKIHVNMIVIMLIFFSAMAIYATWDYININKKKNETDDGLFILIESDGFWMMIVAYLAVFLTFLILVGAVQLPSKDNHKPPITTQF